MKKFIKVSISIFVFIFGIISFSSAQECDCSESHGKGTLCRNECQNGGEEPDRGNNGGGGYGGNGSNGTAAANGVTTNTGSSGSNPSTNTGSSNQSNDECTKDSDCNNGICQQDGNKKVCVENLYGDAGINISKNCLLNGQCSMNVYKTRGIRKSNPDPSVKVFAQDIILGASMFFGTIMTVLLIVSGLSYVMAGYTGKSPDKAKKMMVGSIIGLLFVTFSYTIIRLIQFLATGGS